MAAREGLTIVVGFPKGYVREPTKAERNKLYFKANLTLWVTLGGLLVVFAYYVYAWVAVGRDPPGETIIPRFEPPLELSPACVRFLRRMGYDRKCFTAALLNMAVKRYLKRKNLTPTQRNLARKQLELIIKKYPDTKSANEAQDMLKEIENK